MNLDDYQTVFMVTILGLSLVVVSPTIGLYLPSGGERFSELWILGPGHMAEGYPFNVVAGDVYRVFVGVGCHLGGSTYYAVVVKFRNQTQPLPNATVAEPSSLPALFEFQMFVEDGDVWEAPVDFAVMDVSVGVNTTVVGRLLVNGVLFEVDLPAVWDAVFAGFFYQLFFELWLYDSDTDEFRYYNRFVGLWLNMTV